MFGKRMYDSIIMRRQLHFCSIICNSNMSVSATFSTVVSHEQ